MAIVALVLWALTVAAGVYLLITSTRRGTVNEERPEPVTIPPAVKKRERFDPLSLREAKSEPIPGLRALGEFTHPALAITGFAFWLLYTMVHDGIFGAIALGVLLGTIAAGITWAVSNTRAAKKEREDALSFSNRALFAHGAVAAVTLALAALLIVPHLR